VKTTIDIADPPLAQAKQAAKRQGITLRELVEQGLRRVLVDAAGNKHPFHLAKASFKGRGLRPELTGADWNRLRELWTLDRDLDRLASPKALRPLENP
jgi:hypothetical protein